MKRNKHMSSFHYELDRATEHLAVVLVILENFLNTSRLPEVEEGLYKLNARESINGGRAGKLIEVPKLNGEVEPFCKATLDPVNKLLDIEEYGVGKIAKEIIERAIAFNEIYRKDAIPAIQAIQRDSNLEYLLIPETLYKRLHKIEKLTERLIDIWSEMTKG